MPQTPGGKSKELHVGSIKITGESLTSNDWAHADQLKRAMNAAEANASTEEARVASASSQLSVDIDDSIPSPQTRRNTIFKSLAEFYLKLLRSK